MTQRYALTRIYLHINLCLIIRAINPMKNVCSWRPESMSSVLIWFILVNVCICTFMIVVILLYSFATVSYFQWCPYKWLRRFFIFSPSLSLHRAKTVLIIRSVQITTVSSSSGQQTKTTNNKNKIHKASMTKK